MKRKRKTLPSEQKVRTTSLVRLHHPDFGKIFASHEWRLYTHGPFRQILHRMCPSELGAFAHSHPALSCHFVDVMYDLGGTPRKTRWRENGTPEIVGILERAARKTLHSLEEFYQDWAEKHVITAALNQRDLKLAWNQELEWADQMCFLDTQFQRGYPLSILEFDYEFLARLPWLNGEGKQTDVICHTLEEEDQLQKKTLVYPAHRQKFELGKHRQTFYFERNGPGSFGSSEYTYRLCREPYAPASSVRVHRKRHEKSANDVIRYKLVFDRAHALRSWMNLTRDKKDSLVAVSLDFCDKLRSETDMDSHSMGFGSTIKQCVQKSSMHGFPSLANETFPQVSLFRQDLIKKTLHEKETFVWTKVWNPPDFFHVVSDLLAKEMIRQTLWQMREIPNDLVHIIVCYG